MKRIPCFLQVFCVLVVCLQALVSAPVQAAGSGENASTHYLVAVMNSASFIAPARPALASPPDGAVLDTLIPVFAFDVGKQERTTKVCVAFSTSPHPVYCGAYFFMSSWPNPPWNILLPYNLDPASVYYWRVGVILAGETNTTWSDEWTFTSGPANGPYPEAPALLAPQDAATVPYGSLPLSWSPVSDGLGYHVTVRAVVGGAYYGSTTAYTQLTLTTSYLQPNTSYQWQVSARNSYAWGPDSAPWTFTTGAAGSVPPVSPEPHKVYLDAEQQMVYFEP